MNKGVSSSNLNLLEATTSFTAPIN